MAVATTVILAQPDPVTAAYRWICARVYGNAMKLPIDRRNPADVRISFEIPYFNIPAAVSSPSISAEVCQPAHVRELHQFRRQNHSFQEAFRFRRPPPERKGMLRII